ncbi:MAG: ribonuclease III [Clostridiales bacterium]|nr:ribonuclease III [Clostridiales bacterium]
MLNGLQLAYIGDSVHHLYVRSELIRIPMRVHDLHTKATEQVNAVAQAKKLAEITPLLTEEELSVVARGRNAHPHHAAPKSAGVADYANATGFEALLGFLYLTAQDDRIGQLLQIAQEEDHAGM